MQKIKKIALSFMAMLMVCVMLVSCSNTESSTSPATNEGSDTSSGTVEAANFSYGLASKYVDWTNELKWYDVLLERTGATIELVTMGDADSEYQGMVDQRIISNTLPDVVLVTQAQANVYGTDGAFVDLKPLIETYAPNIQKFIDDNPDYASTVTNENGQIFALYNENVAIANLMFAREDMLLEAGANVAPANLDEYVEMLTVLRDYYSDVENFYPLTGRGTFWKYWLDEFESRGDFIDGTSVGIYNAGRGYDLKSDGFKAMIEWFMMLDENNLVDPEWLSGAGTEQSWEQKMFTGQGAVGYDFYTRATWFEVNGGEKSDPDYKMTILPYMQTYTGNDVYKLADSAFATNWAGGFAITIQAEEKAASILTFLDYLYSPEGMELAQWGVEGESFEKVDGNNSYIVEFEVEEATLPGEKRWSFLSDRITFPRPIDMQGFYTWNTDLISDATNEYFTEETLKPSITLPLTVEEQQEISTLYSAIDTVVQQEVVAFVNGQRPISEWDAFLQEIDDLGYERIIEIQQAAYDRLA